MDKKEYILNEVGLEIARENIAKQMRVLMQQKNEKGTKEKIQQLIQDRDELEKGNMEVIKKYMGELEFE